MKYTCDFGTFEFAPECLEVLAAHRQRSCIAKENGGQLFAQITADGILIEVATITKGHSRRTRYGFWPDRKIEQQDIEEQFQRGLHYVGDWHTHPERIPHPSELDYAKMSDIYRMSAHELGGMLLVIVGKAQFPAGLFVGGVSGSGVISLAPMSHA